MNVEWSVIIDFLPMLMQGAWNTIEIAILGLAGGLIAGIAAGLARAYGGPVLNGLSFAYIELIRGTPIVVQVMFLYFALPVLAAGLIASMLGGVLQNVTAWRDPTLSQTPRVLLVCVAWLAAAPWIADELKRFAQLAWGG